MPAVEDSAIDIVSLRALSFAAIRSAWGSKSCNISRPPFLSRNCRREMSPATTYETILYAAGADRDPDPKLSRSRQLVHAHHVPRALRLNPIAARAQASEGEARSRSEPAPRIQAAMTIAVIDIFQALDEADRGAAQHTGERIGERM